ncbi:MAG: putative Uncharacterized type transport system, ATP-binding component with duplicated domain [Ramlibacter sp.]|nr:putative Uncharacterized type transport system, ATP-binding component with duplicated domain [Ramlibacter sp.]
MARIPEDRHGTGVVGDLPVWENAVSERLRGALFRRGGVVRRQAARSHAQAIRQAFDVRRAGLDAPARTLSGGNMQKLILGRPACPGRKHATADRDAPADRASADGR